ncbi:MAG: heavy-metal-associated domain-containing protein [Clostridium neonatale]
MKSIIKILNMESEKDVKLIQNAIVNNSGIIAIQVSLQKKEIVVIYDSIYLNEEKIINTIEDLAYIVI